MSKSKIKRFFKSQEIFSNFRNQYFEDCRCEYQIYDLKQNIMIEKWRMFSKNENNKKVKVWIVEIYPDGNGFMEYRLDN